MAKDDKIQKTEAELAHDADERMLKALQASNQATIEALMPALVAAMRAGNTPGQAVQNVVRFSREKCTECGQFKVACGNEHIQMVVWPQRYPELAGAFDGVRINSVQYVSVGGTYRVTVPKSCEGNIKKMVQDYENNERDNIMGKKTKAWNSGTLSPDGSNQIRQPTMADGFR